MKTAIVIAGNVRTWSQTKENFIKTFESLDADVFVSTYNVMNSFHPVVASRHNAFEDYFLEKEKIVEMFSDLKLANILVEDLGEVNNFLKEEDTKFHPLLQNLHANCYGQTRKIKQGFDMIKDHEEKNDFKYDRIIKTRSDLVYNDNLDFSVAENNLVFAESTNNPGSEYPCDHILMGTRETMFKLVDFMYNEFYNPVYDDSQNLPPHGFIRNAIRYHNFGRSPRYLVNYILRGDGFHQTI